MAKESKKAKEPKKRFPSLKDTAEAIEDRKRQNKTYLDMSKKKKKSGTKKV